MGKCTDIVVNWMLQRDAINEMERELYKYAFYSLFLLILPFILAVGMGFFLGSVKHGVAIIFPFAILRKYSGGYHAKCFLTCIIESCILLFLCIVLSMYVQCDWKLAIAVVIASASLIIFSPLDNESRRLDAEEKIAYKKITIIQVLLFGLLNIVLFLFGKYTYIICFSIGILLTASLQVPCIVKKISKLTKNIS